MRAERSSIQRHIPCAHRPASVTGFPGRLLRPAIPWVSPVYGWCLFVPGTRVFGGRFSRGVGADLRNARTRDVRDYDRTRGWDSSALLRIGSRIFDFRKRIGQTNFQTAGVSVDALTSQIQSCGKGDSNGTWSAGSTDRRIVVFPLTRGKNSISISSTNTALA